MTTTAPAPAEFAAPAWIDRRPPWVGRPMAAVAIPVSADRVFAAFANPAVRERWLTGVPIVVRFAIPPLHLRAGWADGIGELVVDITSEPGGRTGLAVHHEGLPDAYAEKLLQRFWKERLSALEQLLVE